MHSFTETYQAWDKSHSQNKKGGCPMHGRRP